MSAPEAPDPMSGVLVRSLADRARRAAGSDTARDRDLAALADALIAQRARLLASAMTSDDASLLDDVSDACRAMARAMVRRSAVRDANRGKRGASRVNAVRRLDVRTLQVWDGQRFRPVFVRIRSALQRKPVRIMRQMVMPVSGQTRMVLEPYAQRLADRDRLRTSPSDVLHRRGTAEWSGGHSLPAFRAADMRLVGRVIERRAAPDTTSRGLVVPVVRRARFVSPRRRTLAYRGTRSTVLLNVNRPPKRGASGASLGASGVSVVGTPDGPLHGPTMPVTRGRIVRSQNLKGGK